ncbi:MAG: nitrile hydratase accessory protein [bacterium]
MNTGETADKSISDLKMSVLEKNHEGPFFKEPWQAQAFAMAVTLSEAGLFSWQEWSSELGLNIQSRQKKGDSDDGETYYLHWLETLEKMLFRKNLIEHADLLQRITEWKESYLKTPHGQPVQLKSC